MDDAPAFFGDRLAVMAAIVVIGLVCFVIGWLAGGNRGR
jgi:hypothetical protein